MNYPNANTLIIHHSDCMDGYGAAALVACSLSGLNTPEPTLLAQAIDNHFLLPDPATPVVYTMALHYPSDRNKPTMCARAPVTSPGEKPEYINIEKKIDECGIEFDTIIIVDFSVSLHQLEALWRSCDRMFVLDHHDNYKKDHMLAQANEEEMSEAFICWLQSDQCILASGRAGCGLALDRILDIAPDACVPESMFEACNLISDRDTWNRSNVQAIKFHEGAVRSVMHLRSDVGAIIPFIPNISDGMGYSDIKTSAVFALAEIMVSPDRIATEIDEGAVIVSYRNALLASIVESSALFYAADKFISVPYIVVPTPRMLSSELGDYLRETYPEYHAYVMTDGSTGSHTGISMRSRTPEFNSKEWCESHRGGGHPAAAGCRVPTNMLREFLVNPYIKGRRASEVALDTPTAPHACQASASKKCCGKCKKKEL